MRSWGHWALGVGLAIWSTLSPLHAAPQVQGSARVCGVARVQLLDCQEDTDPPSAVTSVTGSITHSGVTDDWLAFPGGPFSGSAWYAGNLATGALQIYTEAYGHARTSAAVRLKDTLSFAGLAASGSVVRFEMAVSGTSAWFPAPGVTPPLGSTIDAQAGLTVLRGSTVVASASQNFNARSGGGFPKVVVLDFLVTRSAPSLDLAAILTSTLDVDTMNGAMDGGAVMDLGHTGLVKVVLPAGVSMSSSSGIFLSQPVPEPATAGLMLAGLLGLGACLRRAGAVRPA